MNPRRPGIAIPTLAGLAVTGCLVLTPPASAAAPDACATTPSALDFDGDGYDDAAVGDPYATVAGRAEAGAVTVLYGDRYGQIGEGDRQVITQASFGGTPQAGDHFGWDLALAPAGAAPSCSDLVVGAPGEDVRGAADAGTVSVIRDLAPAEGTPDLDVLTLDQGDLGGQVEAGDAFGSAVQVMTAGPAERPRLVVGAPGEDAGSAVDAGAVNIREVDGDRSLVAELRQGRRGPLGAVRLPGTPQTGDRFGSSLAAGPVDLPETNGRDLAGGLAIGAPGDTVSGRAGAGSVTVVSERFETATLLTQNTSEVPGTAEKGDHFGASLALSRYTATELASLAVGSPGEDVGRTADAGSVTLFLNTHEQFAPGRALTQATAGVPGTPEAGDHFGGSLAFGFTATTLLVGVPTEDVGSVVDAGAVQPVRVTPARPLTFSRSITEDARGTASSVGSGHRFGRSLGSLSGRAENILTVSSPYVGRGYVYVLSDAELPEGGRVPARSWVASAGAERFGWSTTN
ncbi:FG-GAP repeat protein [Microlunatus capsulatus]|uniref:FG-GAP repeat-containing protein n=1 Tax=Microlunatus capsulatus TaxID=99117 RepID=A0ABS4Z3K0_9ACTN|nr:FG-GAP repeat protein [Microlunatus capsulatus]MBP2415310.1 hypothetical protein [Microlunatus capsulatus]